MDRKNALQNGAELLRKSDESAYTIVPSHMSSRLSSIHSNHSHLSIQSAELIYRELSIDDDLFTARVYKRNYGHPSLVLRKPLLEQNPTNKATKPINHDHPAHSVVPISSEAQAYKSSSFEAPDYTTHGEYVPINGTHHVYDGQSDSINFRADYGLDIGTSEWTLGERTINREDYSFTLQWISASQWISKHVAPIVPYHKVPGVGASICGPAVSINLVYQGTYRMIGGYQH